jgi:hypothetical protein
VKCEINANAFANILSVPDDAVSDEDPNDVETGDKPPTLEEGSNEQKVRRVLEEG